MAAILCGGCANACSGLCECIGAVCKAPFQLCDLCCKGVADCCRGACDVVWGCCTSPFCCYITMTLLLNLPIIGLGISDLPNFENSPDCKASLFLLVQWIFALIHIIAAYYMSWAVQQPQMQGDSAAADVESGSSNKKTVARMGNNAKDGAGRMKQLFCYDGWMALYIIVLLGFLGWMFVGVSWLIAAGKEVDNNDIDGDGICDDKYTKFVISYSLGWVFLFWGSGAMVCSSCCNMCLPQNSNTSTRQEQPTSAKVTNNSTPSKAATSTASAKPQQAIPVATATPVNDAPKASVY